MTSANDESASANRGSGRRTKSADAFRTISEVSGEVGVPQHVLRFWETKFGQIRPLKRGGGRRYYRPEDIALLNRIRAWLYDDGYTIKGVQKLLRAGGSAAAAGAGRAPAAAEPVQAGGAGRASAGPAAPERAGAAAEPAALRPPEAAPAGVAAGDGRAGGSAAAPVDAMPVDAMSVGAVPDAPDADSAGSAPDSPAAAGADRMSLEPADLAGLIESLEAIRDRLRGPPPEP